MIDDKYYSKLIWKQIECPNCKGKGSIERNINKYYIHIGSDATTGGYEILETCNICNGYKIIKQKILEFKKYTEFNKFEIMDI